MVSSGLLGQSNLGNIGGSVGLNVAIGDSVGNGVGDGVVIGTTTSEAIDGDGVTGT